MAQLSTRLPPDECVRRLREQVEPLTIFRRLNIFRAAKSPVVGDISHDRFLLESAADIFSKRLIGRFERSGDQTIIDYNWKIPLMHRIFGDSSGDESEILSFLARWLNAEAISRQP